MTPSHWLVTSDGTDHPISGLELLVSGKAPSIDVIAHSLSIINRFTGHTTRPYSVAEHSLLVADILKAQGYDHHAQRMGLMHDAHECLTGDASSPVKWLLGLVWKIFENPLAKLFRQHYHLQTAHTAYKQAVKRADLIALATERRDLTLYQHGRNLSWPILDTPGAEVQPVDSVDLNSPVRAAMTWRHHRDAFLERYRVLTAQCSGMAGGAAA